MHRYFYTIIDIERSVNEQQNAGEQVGNGVAQRKPDGETGEPQTATTADMLMPSVPSAVTMPNTTRAILIARDNSDEIRIFIRVLSHTR